MKQSHVHSWKSCPVEEASSPRELGGVFLEAILAIPFLFFIITGLVELGRLLSVFAWVQQTAYQAAIAGGEVSGVMSIQDAEMSRVASRIYNVQTSERSRFNHQADLINFSVSPLVASTSRAVKVKLAGDLRGLMKFYPLDLSVTMTAPVLVLGNAAATNLSSFQNPGNVSVCQSWNLGCTDPATCSCYQCDPNTHACSLIINDGNGQSITCNPADPACHP